MPLGLGTALWAAVLPIGETNISLNPSFENGTVGAFAIQGAALGSSSQYQRYGAWSLSVTPSSNGTSGAVAGTFTTGNGTLYNVSVWARVESGVPFRVAIGDSSGLNLTSGSVTATGGGTWHWYNCAIIEAAQGTRSVVVQKTSGNSVQPFYVDGVKISPWADGIDRTTTYVDGDQDGCSWLAAPHASQSQRDGQYRGGGSIVALADLGLQVNDMIGVGAPPFEVPTQSYAVIDGAQFQRQRAMQRRFTLTAKPIVGTSLADFHVTRANLWSAFEPDRVYPQQPIRFYYVGGQGTVQIDGYYDSGLELGAMTGPIAEDAAISFTAADPYWYSPTQQGTSLAPRVNIGSANYIVKRSALGQWGTLGSNGTTIRGQVTAGPQIHCLTVGTDQNLIIGGDFGTFAGTQRNSLCFYNPNTNTFGSFVGGTINGYVKSVQVPPFGTMYFGGAFFNVGGTAGANNLAFHAGNYGTFPSAAANNTVNVLLYTPAGTLFFGGVFTAFGGTLQPGMGFIVGNAFGSLTGGSVDGGVNALAMGLDGVLYVGGQQTTAGGTRSVAISKWFGSWGTLNGGTFAYDLGNPEVYSLAVGPSGALFIGGAFGTVNGNPMNSIAAYTGAGFSPLGQGFGPRTQVPLPKALYASPSGNLIAGGTAMGSAGGIPLPDNLADFTNYRGGAWTPYDVDLPGAGVINAMLFYQNVLYVAGSFAGTATAAAVGTIVNAGKSQAYPTVRVWNRGATSAKFYQLTNATGSAAIYFNNLSLLSNEIATLNLTPGNRTFSSNVRTNLFSSILPGSNLTAWSLLPGTNYVSSFADSDNLQIDIFWNLRSAVVDGGTVQ